MKMTWQALCVVMTMIGASNMVLAQNVKVTPVGQRTGEFCAQDRAIVFEDPTGVRLLYDPGNTVAGGTDARLGDIHVILISHAHSDHLGNAKLNQDPNSSTSSCSGAVTMAAPNSNTAEIAAAKSSAVIAGGPLAGIIGRLIATVAASPTAGCPGGLTNEITVPRTAPCTAGLGISAKRNIRHMSAARAVQIAGVTAQHTNELSSAFLADPERTNLSSNGLGAYVGLANGFVVTFTNGLRVYLSGDTGLSSDMSTVVRGYYGAALAVINIGDVFTTGPEEAAFAVKELIRPVSVIPSHVNEAATQGGGVVAGSRTARFLDLLDPGFGRFGPDNRRRGLSVFLPLSGVTMEFNSNGRCEVGCQGR